MKKFKERMAEKAGFTLVELIVVIAILGILTAVAVPMYTGYITKANEAGDMQLVSATNTAFAAACVENGVSNTNISAADVTTGTDANGKVTITGITITTGTRADGTTALTDTEKDAIANSFTVYFAGNEDTGLNYYTGVAYDATTHNFKGVDPNVTETQPEQPGT